MSVDRRTDAGEFYPGGKVISTRPVAPGGKVDDAVTRTSSNGVKSSGIWSAIWGALTALPEGFTSLYDWCVSQLAGKANRAANPTAGNLAALDAQGNPTDSGLSKDEVESLLFAQYYPDGSVKSAAELTSGIKYDFNDNDRTASALPFCDTGTGEDNHNLTGRVVIPSFVDRQGNPYLFDDGTKYKVVEVMDDRMDGYGNSGLTDIIAPTTVTRVGVNSFCGCEDLVSASFPGVTTVDLYAFYECSSLETIALPLAATIGDESFVGCSALASVAFPSATSIGDAAFTYCSSLASATLPAVTSIGEQSFVDCSALASVVVPSVRTIGRNAFARCTSLASVEIPSATTVDYAAFTGCRSITAVSAPMVTSVGEQAFKDCSAIASIELPSATGIGANAFWACSSLKSAVLPSATTIGVAAFANCEALASIDIPSATAMGDSAFYHCLALDVLDFGAVQSVPTLGGGAFQDVPTTCKIIVPDAQYDAWTAQQLPGGTDNPWYALVQSGYKFLRHSEWEYARKYELDGKQDVLTFDNAPTSGSNNSVKSGGIWSALWGALSALPTGVASLYDWCVAQLAGKVPTSRTINSKVLTSDIELRAEDIPLSEDDPTSLYWVLEYKRKIWDLYVDGWACRPTNGGIQLLVQDTEEAAPHWFNNHLSLTFEGDMWCLEEEDGHRIFTTAPITAQSLTFSEMGVPSYTLVRVSASLAFAAKNPTAGNLAALDANGNPTDAGWTAGDLARYALPESATDISSASSEVVSGETIYYGEATLADRTQNLVVVVVALDELRVTIPAAVSGKMRDFGLVVIVGSGEGTALAAPALVPVAPTGETIAMMNAEGEMPTLADGTTTASGFTVLYFTEIGHGTFLVKGEQIQGVA